MINNRQKHAHMKILNANVSYQIVLPKKWAIFKNCYAWNFTTGRYALSPKQKYIEKTS